VTKLVSDVMGVTSVVNEMTVATPINDKWRLVSVGQRKVFMASGGVYLQNHGPLLIF
jgi:hypothetical protein